MPLGRGVDNARLIDNINDRIYIVMSKIFCREYCEIVQKENYVMS